MKITIRQKKQQPTNLPALNKHKDFYQTILEVKLNADLDEAEETGNGITATTAKAKIYKGGDRIRLSDEEIEVKNYNTEFSASKDDYLLVVFLRGSWRPISGAGGGTSLAVLKKGNSISKRSGATPGQGTVTLQKYSGNSIETLEKTVTCYNPYQTTIKSDSDEEEEAQDLFIVMAKMSGKWWVMGVDCDEEEELPDL